MEEDRNKLIHIIIIRYVLKTVRLAIVIMFISFLTGIGCFILFQLSHELGLRYETSEDSFVNAYDLDFRTVKEKMIIMAYFSFTTLSTVGFGDFHAISNGERLVMIIIMLLGIMCFSYIMGLFTEILNTFTTINHPIEQYQDLDQFLNVIETFNKKPLNKAIKYNIYDYFEYKWSNDVNQAIQTS
jgi:hypothetical protein